MISFVLQKGFNLGDDTKVLLLLGLETWLMVIGAVVDVDRENRKLVKKLRSVGENKNGSHTCHLYICIYVYIYISIYL